MRRHQEKHPVHIAKVRRKVGLAMSSVQSQVLPHAIAQGCVPATACIAFIHMAYILIGQPPSSDENDVKLELRSIPMLSDRKGFVPVFLTNRHGRFLLTGCDLPIKATYPFFV